MIIELRLVIIIVLIVISFIVFITLYDRISCQVIYNDNNNSNNNDNISGYYAAYSGQYLKRGTSYLNHIPDYFELYKLHQDFSSSLLILKRNQQWYLYNGNNKEIIYTNNDSINEHPPSTNWKLNNNNNNNNNNNDNNNPSSYLIVKNCHGTITNSLPITPYKDLSNIQIMLMQPITMIILFIIYYYAYYIYTNNIEVSLISFSYDSIIGNGEYWRIFTSAFSHVDLLHLGFNTMTLYDIGIIISIKI